MRSMQPDGKASGNMTTANRNQVDQFKPEPDGRYYTRANFFSIRNNSRNGGVPISEKYQTDADPAE